MASNITSQTLLIAADVGDSNEGQQRSAKIVAPTAEELKTGKHDPPPETESYEWKISWRNVFAFIYLHTGAVYGLWLLFAGRIRLATFMWSLIVAGFGALGVTAGAHRLWAHRAYKATWQFRLMLALFQTMAFQNHIYEWVRDHRVHHKFTDTNADPHNAKRGFFFSHIGWLMVRKHEDVKIKGKTIDLSDLERDWVVVWQRRVYLILMPLTCFVIPTIVPVMYWNEEPWMAWYMNLFRYALGLNLTWLVNSAAHIWGTKPFDKDISPTENPSVGIVAMGEGWHNYHHVFPWDYKAAELGNYSVNVTTGFIDLFAKIGWAYDLKTVPVEAIRKRAERTGDGSLRDPNDYNHHMNVWGWGDADMSAEDKLSADIYSRKKCAETR